MQENLSFLSTRHRLPNIRTRRWHRLAARTGKSVEFSSVYSGLRADAAIYATGACTKTGRKNIYLKDESQRFGLKAFKALGGSMRWRAISLN